MLRLPPFDLLDFLSRESRDEIKSIALLSAFSGVSNMALISLINYASQEVSAHRSVAWLFFVFAATLVIFMYGTQKVSRNSILSSQRLIHKFKIRIMGHVFKAQLIKLDEIGRSEILQTLSRDAQMVAQGGFMLVMFGQALATVFFLTIYTLFISWVAFFIIVILALVFLAVSLKSVLTTSNTFKEMLAKDSNVHSLFNDFITGFQEVKMDSRRARDITRHMIDRSRESTEFKGEVLSTMMREFSYMEVLTFVAIGLLIFLVPEISPGFSDHVLQTSTTAMLIVASLSSMVHSMPGLMQANLSARSLFELERRISDEQSEVALKQREIYPMVKSITLRDICYCHATSGSTTPFKLGPINCEFQLGKIYFIRGRNGSGKTTLIRLLAGLYKPDVGEILINNEQVIAQPSTSEYRDLFAAVFSDFHLFSKAFGLNHIDDHDITEMLKQFELETKVSVLNGEFSNVKLSSGQRKRLALVVALLCEKPIIILDEWAADQDPQFRKEFYEIIIPRLRDMGKTIIAITHDEHYYSGADRLFTITNGMLLEEII